MAHKHPTRGELLTRGALASETGCNIETIRYYEQIGILPPPPRSAGGHRLYGPELVNRLQFVRRSRDLGFALEEIRELLSLVDGGTYTCAQIEALALAHVREIQRKIADLNRLKKTLAAMAAQCSGGTIPACPIIDALFASPPPRPTKPASAPSTQSRAPRERPASRAAGGAHLRQRVPSALAKA